MNPKTVNEKDFKINSVYMVEGYENPDIKKNYYKFAFTVHDKDEESIDCYYFWEHPDNDPDEVEDDYSIFYRDMHVSYVSITELTKEENPEYFL